MNYAIFNTDLGWCGLSWTDSDDGPVINFFQLPEASKKQTESRLARRCGASHSSVPPASIVALIDRIRKHLEGDVQDFDDVPIELDGVTPFTQRIYETARKVPCGQTVSYGELAKLAGRPGAARAVGQALRKNPVALIIPCHRILAAGGKPGGFTAHGGLSTKAKLLAIEGIEVG